MKRRTPADWQQLVEDQASSGQTATAFCELHNINPKYFSLRKMRLKEEGSSFVKATIKPTPLLSPVITLQMQSVAMTLPEGTSPQWLAKLLRELAS